LSWSGKSLVNDIIYTKENEQAEADYMHITSEKLPLITDDREILNNIQALFDAL